MSKFILASVYDAIAKYYSQPQTYRTVEEAHRTFATLVNDQEHVFSKYPTDYTLYKVAEFDSETGDFIGNPPELIVKALSLYKEPATNDILSQEDNPE